MDIEKILSMYEDDYNPSSMVPGPRNMYAGGQLVSPSVDGSRPGYSGLSAKQKKALTITYPKDTTKDLEIKRVTPKTVTVQGVTYPNKNTGSIYFNPRDNAFIVRLGKGNAPNNIYKSFSIFNYGTKAKAKAVAEAFRKEEAKYYVPDTTKVDDTKAAKFRKFLRKELSNLKPGEVKKYNDLNKLAKKAKIDIASRNITEILQEPEFEGKVTTPKAEAQKKGFAKKFRDHLIKISKRSPKNKKLLINLTAEAKKLGFEGDYKGARDFKKLQNQGLIKNLVVSFSDTQKAKSNAAIIRLAEELTLNPEVMNLESPKQAISELATNIYGDDSAKNLKAVSADAARYAEHLTGIRKVDGLKLPPLETRGNLLSFILDDTVFSSRNGANAAVVDAMNAMRDSLVGDKPGTLGSKVLTFTQGIKKGYDFDHIAGISATYENAPGYSELGQVIKSNINRNYKKSKIDIPFSRLLNHALGNTNKTSNFMVHGKTYNTLSEAISAFNDYSKNFQKKYNVDSPILRHEPGKKLNAKNYITNYSQLSKGAKQNIDQLASRGIVIENKSKPIDMLLKQSTDKSDKTLNKLLKDFEKHGCGKAAGGRILFSNGTPDGKITTCARRGVAAFIDDLKKGNYSKATMNLLKGGGNVVKNILNPVELVKLRNYFGPVALGFMGAWEAGVIGDDVIRQGTPLNESLANNWLTKAFLPYTKQYAQAKNLLETGKVPSNMKKYVEDVVTFNEMLMDMKGIENRKDSRLVDDSFGMIDGSSMYTKEQEQKENEALMKKGMSLTEDVYTPGSAKALEMKSLLDEMEATRMAKKEFSPVSFKKMFGIQDNAYGGLKDIRTPGYTGFDYIPDEQPVDLRPITYQDAEYTDVKMPVGLEQAYMNKLGLKPRDSLGNYFFKDGPKKKMVYGERKQDFAEKPISILEALTDDYNAFQRHKEASKYPGYFGANEKFSEGGITGLRSKYEYKK